jgi:putative holliday junction resolvase
MPRPIAIEDLAPSLPATARLIGVDLGAKTIGLAISDVERRLASPLKTLPRGAFARDA